MNPRKAGILNIIFSLLFAAAILISSYYMAEYDRSQNITLLLIALWLIPFTYFTNLSGQKKAECSVSCRRK